MNIQVLERVPVEEVNKLIKNGRHRYRHEPGQGAWCRFQGELVEGIAYVNSPRVDYARPLARHRAINVVNIIGRAVSVESRSRGTCTLSVETSQEEVRNFRTLNAGEDSGHAMRYLSVPGHFWARGNVANVSRDDDGAAQVVFVLVGDAFFAFDSEDVGSEAQLTALTEGDAVEFEVRFLTLWDQGY